MKNMSRVSIGGARVVTPGRDLGVMEIVVDGERIVAVGGDPARKPVGQDETIDAGGLIALPGFIDIHSHGRGGADFCDATDAAFDMIGRGKLADGVTGFLATGLTRPEEDLAELCRCVERYKKKVEKKGGGGEAGSTCLGVHL